MVDSNPIDVFWYQAKSQLCLGFQVPDAKYFCLSSPYEMSSDEFRTKRWRKLQMNKL